MAKCAGDGLLALVSDLRNLSVGQWPSEIINFSVWYAS